MYFYLLLNKDFVINITKTAVLLLNSILEKSKI